MRLQAIVTELLFQHALRMRVKSETSATAGAGTDTKGTADAASSAATSEDGKGHLVGRLNNLITSDVQNIKDGNKFWLQLCELSSRPESCR